MQLAEYEHSILYNLLPKLIRNKVHQKNDISFFIATTLANEST